MQVILKHCRTLPGKIPRFLALFSVFLFPVFFPVLFLPVLGLWLAVLAADRFWGLTIRRGQSLKIELEIPSAIEYRSFCAVALRWEMSLPPDREPTIVCFPGVEFQPSELHFPPGFVIRRLRARQKGRFLLNRWYFKVNSRWGLFTLWYPLNLSQVIVVQNPLRRLEQRILRKWPAISHYQNQQGGELEFHSLRQYRPGDPVRQINWKKTARGNAVYLNLFEREEFRQVLFLLHTGMAVNYRWRSDDFLDYNIALLLALSATVLNSYGQAGLIAFSNRVHQVLEPAPGLKQQQRFRKALLHIRSDSKTMPAPQMLSQLTRYIRPGSQVIWLQPLTTPAEAEHFLPVVSHWRQHARLLWISAQRISRSVVSDAILAKWQGEQQQREDEKIQNILTGPGSRLIRARPEDCYREFLAAWQRMELF